MSGVFDDVIYKEALSVYGLHLSSEEVQFAALVPQSSYRSHVVHLNALGLSTDCTSFVKDTLSELSVPSSV